jgi:hypothetical protein
VPADAREGRGVLSGDPQTETLWSVYEVPNDEPRTAVDAEGYVYDVDTGEVLGRQDTPDAFTVDSTEAAEWALELRSKIEGNVAAIEARMRAITENLEAMRRAELRRLAWWEWRFGGQLIDFARRHLPGKSKTWRCPWGRVEFRNERDSTNIADMGQALEYVRCWAPEEVRRVETVTVAGVRRAAAVAARVTGEPEELPACVVVVPGRADVGAIKTGVTAKETRNEPCDDQEQRGGAGGAGHENGAGGGGAGERRRDEAR